MKVAVCISGEMRSFDNKLVLDSLKFLYELNPDIFISTWTHTGFSYNSSSDKNVFNKRSDIDDELLKKIYNTYKNIKSIEIENYNDWILNLDDSIKEIMSGRLVGGEAITSPPQLYKIYRCNELKRKHETGFKYDLVVRIRPDLLFLEALDLSDINSINHINFGIPGSYWPNRIFDIFFYSNSENMDIISDTWLKLKENINDSFDNGLDKKDCCRLLYVSALRNNIKVNDIKKRICGVYRNEAYNEFMNKIKWLNNA